MLMVHRSLEDLGCFGSGGFEVSGLVRVVEQ